MTKRINDRYSKEFREEAAKLVVEGGVSAYEASMTRMKRMQFWGADENDDLLVREVLQGLKTATVCKADDYHLPYGEFDDGGWLVGDLVEVYDLHGKKRCIIEITEVYQTTFGNFPDRLWQEEACRDAEHFREAHRLCWPEERLTDDFAMMAVHFRLLPGA